MKFSCVLLFSFAAFAFAADQASQPAQAPAPRTATTQPATNPTVPGAAVAKKMGTVTWNPDTHKLSWTVQTGTLVDGKFVPASEDRYEISTDEATMGTTAEKRSFDDDEAEGLNRFLDILSLYCAESVAWWDQGAGESLPAGPDKPDATPQKPVKIHQPETKPAPPRPIPGTQVAELKPIQ